MLTELETGLGLEIVLGVQAVSNNLFDLLAVLLHHAIGDIVLLAVLSLVYWSIDRRLGLRLLYALVLAGAMSAALKLLFQSPRPFIVSDAVNLLVEEDGFGLPSGHVMTALALWGYAAFYVRQRWLYWVAAVFVAAVAWARIYAGVHYPQDVIGGVIFGGLALWGLVWLLDHTPAFWERLAIAPQVAMVILAGIVLTVYFFDYDPGTAVTGILVGSTLGLMLERRYANFSSEGTTSQRALRYALGIALTLVVFLGLRVIFGTLADESSGLYGFLRVLRYMLVALVAIFVWPWLAVRLGLTHRQETAAT